MRAEGHCPDCGCQLGVQIDSSVASMMKDTIERLMDRRGNAMYCQDCQEYKPPESLDVIEHH